MTRRPRSLGDRLVLSVAWGAAQVKDLERAEEVVRDLVGNDQGGASRAILAALEEPWLAPHQQDKSGAPCAPRKKEN